MCKTRYYLTILFLVAFQLAKARQDSAAYHEQYRLQLHFSPKAHWTNDPNGMVYYNGIYHLFFQYYPNDTHWGPMHWGHSTSTDLVHWQEQPVALYPDSLGYIFSGSAVADVKNTSGFGKAGNIPLVAIFTHHDPVEEKKHTNLHENQSIAYSVDNGITWTKYSGNPVVKNPGVSDFRDPKVCWFEATQQWIMTVATKDHINFYSSPNLRDWTKESEFGKELGSHGGVWECPDLFALDYKGTKKWVLTVNNWGGPNGGSATQYFTGNFDGHVFTPDESTTRWLDYGPDEYAGVTWSNTGNRKIFLGWMTNLAYANVIPTGVWRGAMTIPRELGLAQANNQLLITSAPVKELTKTATPFVKLTNIKASNFTVANTTKITTPFLLTVAADAIRDFSVTFSNGAGEQLVVGFDKKLNQYYIDRTNAGKKDFHKDFAAKHTAPRFATDNKLQLTLVMDQASVELFADGGLTTMTEMFFPESLLNQVHIQSPEDFIIKSLQLHTFKSIWK